MSRAKSCQEELMRLTLQRVLSRCPHPNSVHTLMRCRFCCWLGGWRPGDLAVDQQKMQSRLALGISNVQDICNDVDGIGTGFGV